MANGETRIEDNEGSIDPELGQEEIIMFRAVAAEAELLCPKTGPTLRSPP